MTAVAEQFTLEHEKQTVNPERVYDVAVVSPLFEIEDPLNRQNNTWFMKAECLQPTGSYKIRPSYLQAREVVDNNPYSHEYTFVAASAGNFGQGVAVAAEKLREEGYNARSVVFAPLDTPEVKVKAMEAYGAKVELIDGCVDDALKAAQEYPGFFVHPFDNETAIKANGTIGTEVLKQLPDIDCLVVAGGGGGIGAGTARAMKEQAPHVQVFVVQLEGADAIAQSFYSSEDVTLATVNTLSDGTAVKKPGALAMDYIRKYADGVIVVSMAELGEALTFCENMYGPDGKPLSVEPAGALPFAAMRKMERENPDVKNQNWVGVASGANADPERVQILKDCFRQEQGKVYQGLGRRSLAPMIRGFDRPAPSR